MMDINFWAFGVNSLNELLACKGTLGEGVYKTPDEGKTWTTLYWPTRGRAISITPNDDYFIGCTSELGDTGGVLHSNDLGITWQWINDGMLTYPNVLKLKMSDDHYLFATGGRIFRSTNPVFDSTYSVRVSVNPASGGIISGIGSFPVGSECVVSAVSNQGYRFSFWSNYKDTLTTDSLLHVLVDSPVFLIANFEQISNLPNNPEIVDVKIYPNPFTSTLTIESTQSPLNITTINIYDSSGKRIIKPNAINSNSTTLDMCNLLPGVYFIEVRLGLQNRVYKVCKIM
jgi:hypothetical protein